MSQSSAVQARVPSHVREQGDSSYQGNLTAQVIDHDRWLLEQSYNLRYQVYCIERGFLPASDYPDQLEIDEFDKHSIHVGVLNAQGDLVGTARLIEPSSAGLPVFHHCSLFEDAPSLNQRRANVIEASRLAVSRRTDVSERRMGVDIVLHIFKGLYQASKRHGFTHWLAATEKSLQRLMLKYGFPWRPVGPESDYYGMVAPYLMNLDEFDSVILSGRIASLNTFLDGLEPQLKPIDVWQLIGGLR
jgi:N-acyl-L-homoserine lactone synthetase